MAKGDMLKGQSEPSDFDIGNGRAVAVVNVNPTTGTPAGDASAALGERTDVAATSDAGTFSLMAFIKRALQNWTTLLTKLPKTFQQTLTVTTGSAYASGQNIGGLQTLTNAALAVGRGGTIQSVVMGAATTQTVTVDVYYFSEAPTASTTTDKVAFSLHADDRAKVIGVARIADWYASAAGSIGQAQNLAIPHGASAGVDLYAQAVSRGTPTFTSNVTMAHRIYQE